MQDNEKTVEERLADLENKMDYIIKILGITSLQNKEPAVSVKIDTPPTVNPIITSNSSSQSVNLLPILAVICFGLAGIFIVKLAIESGWLTPFRQWGLLTSFGITLVAFGLFIEKVEKSYRSYAGTAGIIVLYISSYSSFLYFNITTPIFAQVLAVGVSFLCFYLVNYYKSESFIVISVIGTYISPVLLNKEYDLIFLSGFFLVWACIFSRASTFYYRDHR